MLQSSSVQYKITCGANNLTVFFDFKNEQKIFKSLTSTKPQWVEIPQRSGNPIWVKSSEVIAIEKIESKGPSKNKTIPIKTLAEFAGVHPITINRLFDDTLEKVGKIKRATPKTAEKLRAHLTKKSSGSNIPSKKEFLGLFK